MQIVQRMWWRIAHSHTSQCKKWVVGCQNDKEWKSAKTTSINVHIQSRHIHCEYKCLDTWYEIGKGCDNTPMVNIYLTLMLYVLKALAVGPDVGSSQILWPSFRMGMVFWGWSRAIHCVCKCLETGYVMGSGYNININPMVHIHLPSILDCSNHLAVGLTVVSSQIYGPFFRMGMVF